MSSLNVKSAILKDSCLGHKLDDQQLGDLAYYFSIKFASRGDLLFAEGQRSDTLYLLVDGEVSLLRTNREFLKAEGGTLLGELAFLGETSRTATAVCASHYAKLMILDYDLYEELAANDTALACALVRNIVAEIGRKLEAESRARGYPHLCQNVVSRLDGLALNAKDSMALDAIRDMGLELTERLKYVNNLPLRAGDGDEPPAPPAGEPLKEARGDHAPSSREMAMSGVENAARRMSGEVKRHRLAWLALFNERMPYPMRMDEETLERLSFVFKTRTLERGEVVFRETEAGGYLMLVVDGEVKVRKESLTGKDEVADIQSGQVLGEISFFMADVGRTLTAKTTRPTKALVLTREMYEHLCAREPEVALAFTRALLTLECRRTAETTAHMLMFREMLEA